jgi:hypothetical protein
MSRGFLRPRTCRFSALKPGDPLAPVFFFQAGVVAPITSDLKAAAHLIHDKVLALKFGSGTFYFPPQR